MTFDAQLYRAQQSVATMERAALQRLLDAKELGSSRGLASMYLAGYSVEIHLKAAYFRASGALCGDVWATLKAPADAFAKSQCGIGKMDYHSPHHWFTLLQERQWSQGRALPPELAKDLARVVGWFARNWRVDMRYLDLQPDAGEVNSSLLYAEWVQANYRQLWM